MKTLFITITLLLSISFSSFSQTDSTENVTAQVSKIVKLEKEELPEEMSQTEVVLFSFTVNEDGSINLLDMNFSNENIKNTLTNKLAKAVLKNETIANKVHYFKVLFKRL